MNIININSDIEINPSQKSFIEEVLFCRDDHHMMKGDSFYWLSKQIPIFLLNEDSMRKNEIGREYNRYEPSDEKEPHEDSVRENEIERENRYEPNYKKKPHTEWLGFYGRDSFGLFEHTPRIAICPERIASCVKNDEEFMFLLAIVVVHEFAHAKMDYRDENIKYRKKDLFWHWIEESMANKFTLEVFRNYFYCDRHKKNSFRNKNWEEDLFDFVKNFIKHQPPEYALGYEIFIKDVAQWCSWRNSKNKLGGQKRIQQKNNWLKYMQNNYNNINARKAKELYDELFK